MVLSDQDKYTFSDQSMVSGGTKAYFSFILL